MFFIQFFVGLLLSPVLGPLIILFFIYEALTMSKEEKEARQDHETAVILHLKHGIGEDPDDYPVGKWPPISPNCTGRCDWEDDDDLS